MKTAARKRDRALASQILGYLMTRPDAQDSIEGIAEWWLLEQHIRAVVNEVQAALVDLENKNLILSWRTADGRTYYRLNAKKYKQAQASLQK